MPGSHAVILLYVLLGGCGSSSPAAHPELPAHVDHPIAEADLSVVYLSAEARERIGLRTEPVTEGAVGAARLVGGEVVVPPGHAISVSAPVAGVLRHAATLEAVSPGRAVHRGDALFRLSPLAPADRDVRARAARETAAARAALGAAEARVLRQEELARERAGSARTLEEATLARDVARADLAMAESREGTMRRAPLLADVSMVVRAPEDGIVRTLSVADGQAVVQGAPLIEIVAVDALQIRVPVYSGDVPRLDPAGTAVLRRAGASEDERYLLAPAVGPPTAEPDRMTVDRFFTAPLEATLVPGERVLVTLPLLGETSERTVSHASIVHDAQGGTWVYVRDSADEGAFRRTRIDPIRRSGDRTVFSRGPDVGAVVVSVGAAEVFGAEFEPGH